MKLRICKKVVPVFTHVGSRESDARDDAEHERLIREVFEAGDWRRLDTAPEGKDPDPGSPPKPQLVRERRDLPDAGLQGVGEA